MALATPTPTFPSDRNAQVVLTLAGTVIVRGAVWPRLLLVNCQRAPLPALASLSGKFRVTTLSLAPPKLQVAKRAPLQDYDCTLLLSCMCPVCLRFIQEDDGGNRMIMPGGRTGRSLG